MGSMADMTIGDEKSAIRDKIAANRSFMCYNRLGLRGWRLKVGGGRLEVEGWRLKVGGGKMEVNVNVLSTPAQTQFAEAAPELAAPKSSEASASKPASALPDVLSGPGVRIRRGDSFADRLVALGKTASPDQAAALSNMMKSYFDTMMNTAKNLAPSEKELKLREQRKEELEKQIRDLEAKKVSVKEALIRFENTFLAAADKALLEANRARAMV